MPTLDGREWTIEDILNSLQNLSDQREPGRGQYVRNPLDVAASFNRRGSSQFSWDPYNDQITFGPTDTWSDTFGVPQGSASAMTVRNPDGSGSPAPVTRQQVEGYYNLPPEQREALKNFTPEQRAAFQQYFSGLSGDSGAGVRDPLAGPNGQSDAGPLSNELAQYAARFQKTLAMTQKFQDALKGVTGEQEKQTVTAMLAQGITDPMEALARLASKGALSGMFTNPADPWALPAQRYSGPMSAPTHPTTPSTTIGPNGIPVVPPEWQQYQADQTAWEDFTKQYGDLADTTSAAYKQTLDTRAQDIAARRMMPLDRATRIAEREFRRVAKSGSNSGMMRGAVSNVWG